MSIPEIVAEYEDAVPVDSLRRHPRNPRQGDIGAIGESIERHGFYSVVIAQRSTRFVLAGNHRLVAAQQHGATTVPVRWLDVDDELATRIMLADNRLSDIATNEDSSLVALLSELAQTPSGLSGTGFDGDDLDALLASLGNDAATAGRAPVYDREAVIETAFRYYRANGLPKPPSLSIHECMQQINRLALLDDDTLLTSTTAHHVADSYNAQRYRVRIPGKRTIDEIFARDEYLKHALGMLVDGGTDIDDASLLSVLGFTRNAQVASNFRPGFALAMIRRFCPDGGTVLDTSVGFGGRLVGFIASSAGRYVGIDPSGTQIAGATRLAAHLHATDRVTLVELPVEDVRSATLPEADFALTSPPYFAKERYAEDDDDADRQSWKRYATPEDWRDGFLVPMLALQYAVLRSGAVSLVNIADVKIDAKTDVSLVEWAKEAAYDVGFVVTDTMRYSLSRIPGRGERPESYEPVLVLRKS